MPADKARGGDNIESFTTAAVVGSGGDSIESSSSVAAAVDGFDMLRSGDVASSVSARLFGKAFIGGDCNSARILLRSTFFFGVPPREGEGAALLCGVEPCGVELSVDSVEPIWQCVLLAVTRSVPLWVV